MTILTFEILVTAWNRIKTEKQAALKRLVPGLNNADKIYVKRIAEDESSITVSFQGLDTAVMSPTRDVPLLKNAILSWVRKFSSDAQIMRGDSPMFIVKINKEIRPSSGNHNANISHPVKVPAKYEQGLQGATRELTNIIRKKPVGQ